MSDPWGWVAPAGFGLSLLSLGIQGVRAWRNRSRLAVGLDPFWILGRKKTGRSSKEVEFLVTVQNLGRTPLTVWDVGVNRSKRLYDPRRTVRDLTHGLEFNSNRSKPLTIADFAQPDRPQLVLGPQVPCVIPVGELVEWRFADDVTRDAGDDAKWRGVATQFRANGKHKRTFSRARHKRRFLSESNAYAEPDPSG